MPRSDLRTTYIIDRLNYELGGTEGQVMKLVRGLSGRMALQLIVLNDGPWIRELQRTSDLDIRIIGLEGGVKSLKFWRGFMRLIERLRTSKAEVVHTFFPISNILGAVAARLAGVRVVVGSRRDYGYWMSPGYLRTTRLTNRLVSWIVTNSPEVKRFTTEKEGFDPARIEVIYNGLDLAALKLPAPDLALKVATGIPVHHRVVSLVANYRRIKRQDTLVRAFRRVREQFPDVSLLLIGDPDDPYTEVIRQAVIDCGLESAVFMVHAQGNVAQYLSFTDIGCNCSQSEGLSNAVMEYMAAGIACVVSNGGGNKDLVQHGANGLIFPVDDEEELARQLILLLHDEPLRRRLGEASRARLETEMALPVIIDTFDRFYRRLARR